MPNLQEIMDDPEKRQASIRRMLEMMRAPPEDPETARLRERAERAEAAEARLRAALEPFARHAEVLDRCGLPDAARLGGADMPEDYPTAGDCRRARAALEDVRAEPT